MVSPSGPAPPSCTRRNIYSVRPHTLAPGEWRLSFAEQVVLKPRRRHAIDEDHGWEGKITLQNALEPLRPDILSDPAFLHRAGMCRCDHPRRPRLKLAVSSRRSRYWPCPRRLQSSAGVKVRGAALVGRFSGDTDWPVLVSGDRGGFNHGMGIFGFFAHPELTELMMPFSLRRRESSLLS